jgi:heptosyltransferase-1
MRILFVKTSSLGDVVHHCPAVSDAARALPGLQIDWVVEDSFAEIPQMHHAVRRVIPVAVRRWRRAPWKQEVRREFAEFRRLLSGERYDRIVDTQGLLKSAVIARLASGTRHGYDKGSARESFASRLYAARHPVARRLHAVERNRQLTAAALGYAPGKRLDYGLQARGTNPVAVQAPYCVLLTMTSRAAKLWPEEDWIALGARLATQGTQSVLPWGSEPERARSYRIAAAIKGAVAPPRLTLSQLASLMSRARAVVGVDTGLTHLGVALGMPSVGIFCNTDPALTGLYGTARCRNVGGVDAVPSWQEALAALEEVA